MGSDSAALHLEKGSGCLEECGNWKRFRLHSVLEAALSFNAA